ncbi:caspase family protein [Sphingobium sp. Cam5-1]|nr:caspase family protein [Sphingobium sp. Cam5-1]
MPDLNSDEPDGLDETWCLYDGQLIDDELSYALSAFKAGVRIIVVSDSCHSGSVVKTAAMQALHGNLLNVQAVLAARAVGDDSVSFELVDAFSGGVPRVMPQDVMSRVYLANKDFYDEIGSREELSEAKNHVAASVILLSGCQDYQLSMDGPFNGAFTGALKVVWNGGKYADGYDKFIGNIRKSLNNPTQSPGIFRIGARDTAFDAQQPFLV